MLQNNCLKINRKKIYYQNRVWKSMIFKIYAPFLVIYKSKSEVDLSFIYLSFYMADKTFQLLNLRWIG